jgi:hypothetical protein
MNITIDIRDYLSADEIRDICKDTIAHDVHMLFAKNETEIERLISNLGYEFLFAAVSESIGKDAKKLIAEKVIELIKNDSSIKYEIWRRQDVWQRTESPAIKTMNDAIEDNKHLIRDRVITEIEKYPIDEIRDEFFDMAVHILEEKLFGGKTDER